ncbi:hypothetical protein LX15_000848 [Streptoalloteichus tenebrarius]|uniref:Uncharacterized protein n=1 Tax=Streptoalloteichus tenebrarius (strain ATCC 17920 / DSM 40477 / JCM 4838 / CBS 697.72 / NBRC 16177 / NCIMB 11028 / NRRL B-12390 / A12253. 1 / ISP 5477) TaxID=1933 RepID=A0ABT1HNS6_STRSD|nr:hypothetical protein [Streptoalloteichus tenebrarius]MCP2257163.1 hypothetical protein [Streptoalloteichus tenebrarius]BFE98798.1 hypothetical protein GCM10020241_04740 [Streptoalloteichus tenebrarius]
MSDELYWAEFDGNVWPRKGQIGNATTSHAPALAVYKDVLFCVFTGKNKALYWTRWDGSNWSPATPISTFTSGEAPALAVAHDKLYCVHRGASDTKLYSVTFSNNTWESERIEISGASSPLGPGLTAYRGNVYCAYQKTDAEVALWVNDGKQWKDTEKPMSGEVKGSPTLAAYQARLWCAYPGREEGSSLNWSTYVEPSWRLQQDFPQYVDGSQPALCVYSGLLHCFHVDTDGTSLVWSTSRGDGWSQDQWTGLVSKTAAGLAPLKDKLYCVYVNP